MLNLIGLNGYISSGKDTVAKMIIWLTNPKERELWNNSLEDFLYINPQGFNWEIKKFAGKLKQMVSLLTGIPVEDLEKQEVKQSELGKEWNWVPKAIQLESRHWITIPGAVHPEVEDRARKMTVRELLQKLATEACRNVIHEDIWVNALFTDYRTDNQVAYSGDTAFCNWIISDTRFSNEAKTIKDRGGIVVRINRAHSEGYIPKPNPQAHSSETSLDNWAFDYTIDNSGSLEDLLERVREMLLHFKIIQ